MLKVYACSVPSEWLCDILLDDEEFQKVGIGLMRSSDVYSAYGMWFLFASTQDPELHLQNYEVRMFTAPFLNSVSWGCWV